VPSDERRRPAARAAPRARPRPVARQAPVIGAGDLQRSLQRDLSVIGVLTLSVLLAWSGVNTYYGAYSGGLAWVEAARRTARLSHERDLRALLARADQLDAAPEASSHISGRERWVCALVEGAGAGAGLRGAEGLSEELRAALVGWLRAPAPAAAPALARAGFLWGGGAEGGGVWAAAAAAHAVGGARCALIAPVDAEWLSFVKQLGAVEVALLGPEGHTRAHTLSALTLEEGARQGIVSLAGAQGDVQGEAQREEQGLEGGAAPRYAALTLAAPYGGPYAHGMGEERFGRFHVGQTRLGVFVVDLALRGPSGARAGALRLMLPEDVLLLWPKRGVLGTLLLGAALIGLTLWRTRARVSLHLSPLTQLVLDLEALSVSMGSPPTLRERHDTPFCDINHLRRVLEQLKRQVTERERLEEQLRQAQKMEAIGVLAGGVAHDFNNLLSVIVLNAEALTDELDGRAARGGEGLGELLEMTREVSLACEQAKSLTRQLLSLSKDRGGKQGPVELGASVADTVRLMRRLLPEALTLTLHAEAAPLWVEGNASALQQALMNLLINARDAMEAAGRARGVIDVRLRAHTPREPRAVTAGLLRAEPYVALSVRDAGTGITPEHLAKLFDPFFSTKGAHGTGLGLAVVYTTVVQHMRGAVEVSSTLGEGAELTLYLPRRASGQPTLELTLPPELTPGAPLSVAIIEDHEQVRRALTLSLEKLGVHVYPFGDGEAFARWFEAPSRPRVHAVVSDVVMPNESGPEVWVRARLHDPAVPFLFLTGYADEALSRHRVPADRVLSKPVTGEELHAKLRALLGQR